MIIQMNTTLLPFRPTHRLHQSIPISTTHAITMHDATLLSDSSNDIISFELKPKWATFNDPYYSTGYCRFCIHAHYRSIPSEYCPLDLFSNSSTRIHHAISCLVKTPSNNLKYFINGMNHPVVCNDDNLMHHLPRLVEILVQDPLLSFLSLLQHALSTHSIHQVYECYQTLLNLYGPDWSPTLDHYHQVLSTLQDYNQLDYFNSNHPDYSNSNQTDYSNSNHLNLNDSITVVSRFLLNTSLKDCSIIISFSSLTHYSIKLVDLDMKSMHKIPTYLDTEQSMIE